MIPNVFISSTISDLNYLRDSIRDLINELGYNPIMSEYGDIGYLPSSSAEESCYITMKQCQLAVIIVGKRYGSISKNELSVTHNEFKTAIENKVPVIFLVDQEMLTFKKVFESNDVRITIPGVENPLSSFGFIRECMSSEVNNGILPFTNTLTAKDNLRKQIAHIFGELLKNRFDSSKSEIKDILSEISTLKHILLKNEKELAEKFSKAFRFLLKDENKYLNKIAETISGSLEKGVQDLLEASSFKIYLEKKNVEIKEINNQYIGNLYKANDNSPHTIFDMGIQTICHNVLPYETIRTQASFGSKPEYDVKPEDEDDNRLVFAYGSKKFWGDKNAFKLINIMFDSLKEFSTIKN